MNLFIILYIKEVIPPGGKMPVGNVGYFLGWLLGYEEGFSKLSDEMTLEWLFFWVVRFVVFLENHSWRNGFEEIWSELVHCKEIHVSAHVDISYYHILSIYHGRPHRLLVWHVFILAYYGILCMHQQLQFCPNLVLEEMFCDRFPSIPSKGQICAVPLPDRPDTALLP